MSSKDILSEGELDALMDSVSNDEIPTEDASLGQQCQAFDFSTREQTLLAQMPALKNLNEKLSLELVQGIAKLYRIPAEVEAEEVQLHRLDQAIVSISQPSGINLVRMSPLNGISLVVVPGDLLSFFVDKYFGGGEGSASINTARESLTLSERRINDALTGKFLASLASTWQEKIQLAPEVKSFESNPDFLQLGSGDELVLCFSFAIKVGTWSSSIDWFVPYASLEPLRSKLGSSVSSSKPQQKNLDWEKHFRRELQSVELEISGSFTSEEVSIAEVLGFKPGSIVPLKMPTEVTVCVEDQAFSYGEHGVLNGHKSIKIKERIK